MRNLSALSDSDTLHVGLSATLCIWSAYQVILGCGHGGQRHVRLAGRAGPLHRQSRAVLAWPIRSSTRARGLGAADTRSLSHIDRSGQKTRLATCQRQIRSQAGLAGVLTSGQP